MSTSDNNGEEATRSNRPACASCKHQRKKCQTGCVMARHFPQRCRQDFLRVHRIFGISNVSKMIKMLKVPEQQDEAVKSLFWEASMWRLDPVHGPYGQYKLLEDQLKLLHQQQVPPPPNNGYLVPAESSNYVNGSNNLMLEAQYPYYQNQAGSSMDFQATTGALGRETESFYSALTGDHNGFVGHGNMAGIRENEFTSTINNSTSMHQEPADYHHNNLAPIWPQRLPINHRSNNTQGQ